MLSTKLELVTLLFQNFIFSHFTLNFLISVILFDLFDVLIMIEANSHSVY